MWQSIKAWAYKWIGGLFLEDKGGAQVISLGRVTFLIVFGWMLTFWTRWYLAAPLDAAALAAATLALLPLDQSLLPTDVANACRDAIASLTASRELPPGILEVFWTLTAYVFGGKVTDALKTKWTAPPASASSAAPVRSGEAPAGEGP
jgi:hypothetical protein